MPYGKKKILYQIISSLAPFITVSELKMLQNTDKEIIEKTARNARWRIVRKLVKWSQRSEREGL